MKKRDKLRVPEYLEHIIEAIHLIATYVQDMDENKFLDDKKTQDAVIRNFEVIGEACNNVRKHYPDFIKQHEEIPWAVAYEMRNSLAHGYFKIDLQVVWNTIHEDFPTLAQQVKAALNQDYPSN